MRQFDLGIHAAQRSQEAYDAWVLTKIDTPETDPTPTTPREEVEARFDDLWADHAKGNAGSEAGGRDKAVAIEVDEALLGTAREQSGIITDQELVDTALAVLVYKQADLAMLREAIEESR